MPAEVGVTMKAHKELVSQVTDLRETLAQVQSALAQYVTERAHLREALDQMQSSFAQSSTALTAFQEQVSRCSSLITPQQTPSKGQVPSASFDGADRGGTDTSD